MFKSNVPLQCNFLSGSLCCYCQPVVMYCIYVLIRTRIFTCRLNDKSVLLFNDYCQDHKCFYIKSICLDGLDDYPPSEEEPHKRYKCFISFHFISFHFISLLFNVVTYKIHLSFSAVKSRFKRFTRQSAIGLSFFCVFCLIYVQLFVKWQKMFLQTIIQKLVKVMIQKEKRKKKFFYHF